VPAPTDIQAIIIKWAGVYGVSTDTLLRVAKCESTFRPTASNGAYLGLFQFLPSTFNAYAPAAGVPLDAYWDADASAHVAAYMFSIGQGRQWECQ
jgi:soluble lytic murein transglycosylase-like protein